MKSFVLELPSQTDKIEEAAFFVENALKNLAFDPDERDNVVIAATEAISNAIIHGNKNNPQKKVTIVVKGLADRIEIHVRDEGNGFEPGKLANPLAPENLLRESGRGIFILKSLMDKIDYRFLSTGTEIVLTKFTKGKKQKQE